MGVGVLPGGFWIGTHMLTHACAFERTFISVNRLWGRRRMFLARSWVMDSGAFTELNTHGVYRHAPQVYAREVNYWACSHTLRAAVTQDYMCEPFILRRTGLEVRDHQRLTVERYDALLDHGLYVYLMPVLQGYQPAEYVSHLRQYGRRLAEGQWVGVGSVCKRNASPDSVYAVLRAVASERPDLRLHGFGLKLTALGHPGVRCLLHSCDSMAWSAAARRQGRDANGLAEAQAYWRRVHAILGQLDGPAKNGGP